MCMYDVLSPDRSSSPRDGRNHWLTIPTCYGISFFLFGIEEIGIQIEEPFSILPIEAFCNGAIYATMEEMVSGMDAGDFEYAKEHVKAGTAKDTSTFEALTAAAPVFSLPKPAPRPRPARAASAPSSMDSQDWWKSFANEAPGE